MSRPRFEIVQEDMGGWVRVVLGRGEPTGELGKFLSHGLTDWMRKRPHLRVRFVVPISRDGDTAELHAWYDQVSFPDTSPWRTQNRAGATGDEMDNPQPPQPDDPEFLTVKQAARHLNVSLSCVYGLCYTNKLTHYKFGDGRGAVRIRRDDLLDMIQRCRIEKEEGETRTGESRKPVKQTGYVYKHLNLRPKHACGGTTKAGTPCTRMTRDERCRQHRG